MQFLTKVIFHFIFVVSEGQALFVQWLNLTVSQKFLPVLLLLGNILSNHLAIFSNLFQIEGFSLILDKLFDGFGAFFQNLFDLDSFIFWNLIEISKPRGGCFFLLCVKVFKAFLFLGRTEPLGRGLMEETFWRLGRRDLLNGFRAGKYLTFGFYNMRVGFSLSALCFIFSVNHIDVGFGVAQEIVI